MIDTDALRKKVIDLAIQGKLTEQLPSDGDAETLYAQIQEKKAKLIKEGKIKKQLTKDVTEDVPFDIPANWKWVRIGDIEEINLGFTYRPEYVDDGVFFLSAKDITGGKVDFSEAKKVSVETYEKAAYGSKPHKGDILFCRVGTIGKPQVIYDDVDFCIFVSLGFFRDHFDLLIPEYIVQWMNSKLFERQVDIEVKGALQRNLNTGWLKEFLVPLPPFAEQKRIVEKLNVVLSQIDIIDDLQSKYSNDLAVLKKKIIDAGIQGKLTEQLPEDGDSDELIERIADEKSKLIEAGKIPKEKKLPKISDEEKPFDIPGNWRWVRVQDVASYITDYVANGSFATLKANTKTYREPNYAIFVRTMDFGTNFKEGCLYIDKESYDFLEKSRLFGGELIIPNIGASIGKAFIMPDLGMPMSLAPNSILLKFTEPVMNEFFSFVIKSTYGARLLNKTQGGSATAKFSKTDLRTLVVPLPPFSEIKRIVDRINSMSLIMEQVY